MNVVVNEHSDPYLVDVYVQDTPMKMELDTGAAVSVINAETLDLVKRTYPELTIAQAESKLKTYTGQDIQVLGVVSLNIRYRQKDVCSSIHVVAGGGPNLLGRDLITALLQDLKQIRSLNLSSPLQVLLDKHSTLFSKQLGGFNGPPVSLAIKDNAAPKFHRARPVTFALKDKVEKELQDLQDKGIISPVQHSAWAAPIVAVLKKSGEVRLCGDYKLTINQAAPTESYPLPHVDELLANMSGAKYFTKLDLTSAYLQMPLDPASREYVTAIHIKVSSNTTASRLAWLLLQPSSSDRWKRCCKVLRALAFTLMLSSSQVLP